MDWFNLPAVKASPSADKALIFVKILLKFLLNCLFFVRRNNITIRINIHKPAYSEILCCLLNYPFKVAVLGGLQEEWEEYKGRWGKVYSSKEEENR